MPNLIGSMNLDGTLRGVISGGSKFTGKLANATLRGMPVQLQISGTILQWRYEDEDDSSWRDLSDVQASDSLKINKPETIPDGTNGQLLQTLGNGKTQWTTFGTPTDAQVGTAVDDWLNAHLEATTTVQDGSITETKIDPLFLPNMKNNYVTPEMFGAKGDGTTDDTLALQNMFASNATIFQFGSKTYLVNGSIDVTKACDIYFNTTTLQAAGSNQIRDFEYIIGFKAQNIQTHGVLIVKAQTSVNIGVYLESCGRSNFDTLIVSNARIWGISTNVKSNGNNSINFNKVIVSQCGYKVHAKARRLDTKKLEITEMSSTTPFFATVKESLFGNQYNHSVFVIDDSGYTNNWLFNRLVFAHDRGASGTTPFTLDAEDPTKAIFEFTTSGANAKTDYTPGEDDARDVFIPIGGGICLNSSGSEGVINFNHITTQMNPIGFLFSMGYAGHIGCYCSEFDTMVMVTNALALNINYLYTEAVGSGYSYKFNNEYDRIILFTSFDSARVYVNSPLVRNFKQGNSIVNGFSFGELNQNSILSLQSTDYLSAQKLTGQNWVYKANVLRFDVDEYSPRNITIDAPGYSSAYTVRIGLLDLNAQYTNRFEPLILYVRRSGSSSNYDSFVITLTSELINAGYTINGSVNNLLTIHPSEYNNYMKVTVILFRQTNTFFVAVEPLTFVDNTVVEGE